MINIDKVSTEGRNQNTINIDTISTIEMVNIMNKEDAKVSIAVSKELKNIAKIIDESSKLVSEGGRVIYIGAGTSGRLGILDASEILPTFGEGGIFHGLIAGGVKAIQTPVENAEDDKEMAINDLENLCVSSKDIIIGIAASGRTPYVVSALEYAKKNSILSASISTSFDTEISKISNIPIEAVVGPEVITGSTRMKSGTAQKLILNMISTGIMIKMNKVYSNYMVDIKATNKKLIERSIKMIQSVTKVEYSFAQKAFTNSRMNVKLAIIMLEKNINIDEAKKLSMNSNGKLRSIIG